MFSNVGKKIKTIAKYWFWVGISASVVRQICFVVSNGKDNVWRNLFIAFINAVVCGLFVWITSVLLYGFGHSIVSRDLMLAIYCDQADGANDDLFKYHVLEGWKSRGYITEKEFQEKEKEWGLK